jgi:hypothetical protein
MRIIGTLLVIMLIVDFFAMPIELFLMILGVLGFVFAIVYFFDWREQRYHNGLAKVYGSYFQNEMARITWFAKAEAFEKQGVTHITFHCNRCNRDLVYPVGRFDICGVRCDDCRSITSPDNVKAVT